MMTQREREIIGTLAHNRHFTAAEITEYTRFEDRPIYGPTLVRRLVQAGLVERTSRGQYFPTPAGWTEIEK